MTTNNTTPNESTAKFRLNSLQLSGFKSIASTGQQISFGDVTVLLGANGCGKSNLISFFKMLNHIVQDNLPTYVGKQGGTDALLFYGSAITDKIDFALSFQKAKYSLEYYAHLQFGMPDRLFFEKEGFAQGLIGEEPALVSTITGTGNSSSALFAENSKLDAMFKSVMMSRSEVLQVLSGIHTYQFHDTSDTAKIKRNSFKDDAHFLREDAANLAAFLRVMKETPNKKAYYQRIVRHIQHVMPQFGDFDLQLLADNNNYVRLNWREKGGDYLFGAHQISDGSLRFMALATLLLQPPDTLPSVIVLDEPELGLHPAAIAELAAMIRTASRHSQLIIATQSTRLVDEFGCDNLVIVERDEAQKCSVFKRLEQEKLAEWLKNYSLSELWEKNVLGGRP